MNPLLHLAVLTLTLATAAPEVVQQGHVMVTKLREPRR